MTTAAAADQQKLLKIQACDSRLAQLEHLRVTLPEAAEVGALSTRIQGLRRDIVLLETRITDLDREVARAENDVATVRARAERDRTRLDSGAGGAKDLVGLTHELESLAKRQSALEDIELDVLERREADQGVLTRARTQLDAAEVALVEATTRRDLVMSGLAGEYREVRTRRNAFAASVDPALLALYDKIRASRDGVGAAALAGGRCQGCHLDLPPSDLAAARTAAPDQVVRCEECGRILVRSVDNP